MRDIYSHHDLARVSFFRSVLQEAGVEAFIKNEVSFNTTELTALIVAPTLCVINDEDFDRAKELLRTADQPGQEVGPDWKCAQCGEMVPANFGNCWLCDAPAPTAAGIPEETPGA